jgi:hypothetical protein
VLSGHFLSRYLLPTVIYSPGPHLTPIKAKTHWMSRPHSHLRLHPHLRPHPHSDLRLHPHLCGEQLSLGNKFPGNIFRDTFSSIRFKESFRIKTRFSNDNGWIAPRSDPTTIIRTFFQSYENILSIDQSVRFWNHQGNSASFFSWDYFPRHIRCSATQFSLNIGLFEDISHQYTVWDEQKVVKIGLKERAGRVTLVIPKSQWFMYVFVGLKKSSHCGGSIQSGRYPTIIVGKRCFDPKAFYKFW